MFIGATQVKTTKAPLDAGSVAIQVAIKQQREFEEALRVAQDRREAEQASEQARLAERQAREKVQESHSQGFQDGTFGQSEHGTENSAEGNQGLPLNGSEQETRGSAVDVTA
ncbi:MAG: hypothetical protein CMF69_08350 [Magnetovibrio sp.]|nr:hypothetical protein [Magnetovibrio sp.]|tara:strand:- start:215 stop:550 length:336 start_codon:yes stop_codon:yes gene_type:complete